MLFKTIEDEATLSGLRIQSIFGQLGEGIRSVFSSNQMDFSGFSSSLNDDIIAIQNYSAAVNSGMSSSEAFSRTMVEASSIAQQYVQSVNAANISTSQFETFARMNAVTLNAQNKSLGNIRTILNEYNGGLKNCQLSQKDFITAVGQSNANLGKYLNGLNGGTASMKGYIASLVGAKVASIALQAATMALNMALTMGISALVSWGISAFTEFADAIHVSAEEIKEAAEDIRSSYETATSEFNTNVSTLTGLESEFNRLSKGVSDYGDNIYLTASEYERYQSIVAQIVGMSPTLCAGYDAEGNAIANKNGLIEKSIELLKEKQRLELAEYTSDDALTTSGMAYVQDIKDFMKDNPLPYGNAKYEFMQAFAEAANSYDVRGGQFVSNYDLFKAITTNADGTLKKGFESYKWSDYSGIGSDHTFAMNFAQKYYDAIVKSIRDGDASVKEAFTQSELDTLAKKAMSVDDNTKVYNDRMNEYSKALNSQLQLVASTAEGYDKLSAAQKSVIASYVGGDEFKLTADTTEDEILDMKYKIQDFVKTVQDGEVSGLINDLFSLDKSNIVEYSAKVDELVGKIADKTNLNKDSLMKDLGFSNVKKLDSQIKAYNELTEKILNCNDAQEKNKLIVEQTELGNKIAETTDLVAQYDALTAAYERWQAAQSTENEGSKYDSMADGLENIKKLYEEGLVGTDDFQTAVELMSNQDLSGASVEEYVTAYEKSYPVMQKYFKDGRTGCENFLNDLQKLNTETETFAKINEEGKWEIDFNEEEVADKLGISVGAIQAIMKKLKDFGFEIDLSTTLSSLEELKSATETANDTLQELQKNGKIDLDFEIPEFDVNSTNGDDLIEQISQIQAVFDKLARKEDGSIDLSVEGAQEAKTILAALIYQKQQVSEPAIIQLTFDASTATTQLETAAALMNDFRTKYRDLEVKIATGEDTSALQTEIQGVIDKINELPSDVKASLGLDTEEFNTAITTLSDQSIDVKAGVSLDQESLTTVNTALSGITADMLVTAGLDDQKIKDYDPNSYGKTATVTYNLNDDAVKNYNPPNLNRTVTYTVKEEGTVGARGTAFVNGDWGASKSGVALGGELGRELVVRNGKYFTIGDEGAEFFHYQKDDIIFNAEQTKQIFEKGKITAGNRRGRALASGTAFATGTGRFYGTGTTSTTTKTTTTTTTKKETYDKPSTYTKSDDTTPQIQAGEKKSSDEESEFERQYKYHQHLLNMDKESLRDYLDWLVVAYKEAYEQNQIETEDYYKYAEEVYEKSKALFDDLINDSEHKIDLWKNQGGNEQNIIAEYKTMQEAVHNQAEYYRSLGLDENHENIQELQKQWWDYENAIRDTNAKIYEDIVKNSESAVALNEIWLNNAAANGDYHKVKEYSANIIAEYKTMQEAVHNQAEYYRSLGYSDTSEEVSELSELWWDYQEAIIEAGSSGFQILVDNANNALDDIQGVYDTLKNAAKEYADSGHITGDTYQEILSMGVEYLAMLRNENGELVINERTIKKVIKAKTNQLGIETALNYIQSLRTALTNNDTQALNNLLTATDDATRSTWGLVYAQLAMLDLSDEQYKNAFERINMIRSLTETAIDGVGKPTDSLIEGLNETSEALQSILDYVIEVIRQETENKIENLEEQISDYKEIVDLQKESLQTTKDQNDYNKNVTDKLKEIAEIQNRINQLSLDDSREAQAEKKSLEEELAELQGDLADTQADYAYDKQVESLDKMAEAYEEEKNEEIEILRDNISSYQKLYDLAIDRIEEEGSGLLSTLLTWNEQYGNDLNETIETAWDNACDALDTYNYKLEKAMSATKKAIENSDNLDNTSLGDYSSSTDVRAIREQMKANSLKWYTVDEDTQDDLAETNASYASQLDLTPKDGSWYSGNEKFYSIGTWEAVDYIVKAMKNNSSNWTEGRTDLESANERMASYIESLSGQKVWKDGNGVWWIGNDKLYDSYGTYHTGGIVGGNATIKDNEVLSLLEKGEVVLDEEKKKNLYRILDDSHPWLSLAQKMSGVIVENNANSVAGKFKDMMNKDIANTLSQVSSDNSTDIRIDKVEVHAPIQVTEKLDKSDIKKHSKLIGEVSAGYIKEGFTKRGIKPTAQLF